jgi:uncharacterized protein YciU (UPF0263 family)
VDRYKSRNNLALTTNNEIIYGARVKITCNFQPQYYLIADVYQNLFEIERVPGKILLKDRYEANSWSAIVEAISDWVEHIYLEITSHPVARIVVELDEEMEEILKQIDELPNEYFTKEQGRKVIDRLNELESKFKAYFEQLEEGNADVKTQLTELTKDMEFLRASVFNVTQKKWARIFTNRLGRLLNSPAGQAILSSGVSTVIKGLLEGPK